MLQQKRARNVQLNSSMMMPTLIQIQMMMVPARVRKESVCKFVLVKEELLWGLSF